MELKLYDTDNSLNKFSHPKTIFKEAYNLMESKAMKQQYWKRNRIDIGAKYSL